jgi:mannose-6-phosphate isomerase-like protein (cupin superfamily)
VRVAFGPMTYTALRTAAVAAVAFAAGLAVAHAPQPARAASAPLQPAVIDVAALAPSDLPAPTAASPNLRSKLLAVADGATAQVQIGTVAKHYHADANEIQIVISGSGTEWLGDKQVALKPGTVLIIPAGTPHAGTTDANLKIVAIKTPPQAAMDVHPVP